MSYSTPTLVRAALVPGGGAQPDDGSNGKTAAMMSDDELQGHIDEADARIDSYLAQRYALPIASPAPTVLANVSRDIAAYLATLAFRKNKDLTAMDPVYLRYSDAMAWLKAVGLGQIVIPGLGGATGDVSTGEAGTPLNGYTGDLFGTSDFDLRVPLGNWPEASRERW